MLDMLPKLILGLICCSSSGLHGQESPSNIQVGSRIAILEDTRISECSGIVRSYKVDDYYWLHNDSGYGPYLFLVNSKGGTVGRVKVDGASSIDWEDIAIYRDDEGPVLIVGDIGGNAQRRNSISLFFVREPTFDDGQSGRELTVTVEFKLNVTFPGGVTNYEAIAVDPLEKSVVIIEKALLGGKMYSVPLPNTKHQASRDASVEAKEIGRMPLPFVTACDISEDGKSLVAISYRVGVFYERTVGRDGSAEEPWSSVLRKEPVSFPLGSLRQTEAVCFLRNGKSVIVSSEFAPTPLVEINLPNPTK